MNDTNQLSEAITIATPVIKESFNALKPMFKATAARAGRNLLDRALVALEIGFQEYLITSYNQCRYFKSILATQVPLDVITHYTNVTLSCNKDLIKDDDLIDRLQLSRNVVITGLAGSGKSMFMKYLTLRHFEQPKFAIPLFVELKRMNELTTRNLLSHIRGSCTGRGHEVSEQQFDLALRAGAFILVLDGFDEVNYDIRDEIQKEILDISRQYPNTTIVLSSRPDERFAGWSSFYVFKIEELSMPQVIKLLESLPYDSGVRRRFIKVVRESLYDKHKSFLSSPLLASMMLLTYEQFAEIPTKMHLFYSQAFDTLLQKHDAQKEQFKRKTYSGLSRDDFKLCFATFCAMTYVEEKFSFNSDDLNKNIGSAISYCRKTYLGFSSNVTVEQFRQDLFETVCMLQQDGIEYTFVHRSFQEYFAALFVTQINGEKQKKFLDRYSRRYSDSVVPMAYDMAQEAVENNWVMPVLKEVGEQISAGVEQHDGGIIYAILHEAVYLFTMSDSVLGGHLGLSAKFSKREDYYAKLKTIFALYGEAEGSSSLDALKILPAAEVRSRLIKRTNRGKSNYSFWSKVLKETKAQNVENEPATMLMPSSKDRWWVDELGITPGLLELPRAISKIEREIASRNQTRAEMLDDLF